MPPKTASGAATVHSSPLDTKLSELGLDDTEGRPKSEVVTDFVNLYSPRFKEIDDMLWDSVNLDGLEDFESVGSFLVLVLQSYYFLIAQAAKRGGISREDILAFPDKIKDNLTRDDFAMLTSETANVPQDPHMMKMGKILTAFADDTDAIYIEYFSESALTDIKGYQEDYHSWYNELLESFDLDDEEIPK
ncbi:MAG: hypothetical protein M1840_001469 [Geoglossum simile]|nr:MAG: hypothetical protein M1840_001469 [Geoglossum simile]